MNKQNYMIELSKKAKEELKDILIKDVGLEVANSFTDEELNRFGVLCLTILRESLKMEVENDLNLDIC